jgi:SAM-dependent methyltransferase
MSAPASTVVWHEHRGRPLDAKDGFQVIDCVACLFRHVVPIPTRGELERVYRDEYYAREKPLYLERARADLAWWNLVHDERYETLERHLEPERRRILDVGSGPGFFLQRGRERGWQVQGLEPAAQAAAHARALGLPIVEAFLDEAVARSLGCFDAVHLAEVLEHLCDPRAFLELVRDLLFPRGLVSISVPNDYNPFQLALREALGFAPWWVAPPHHLNYFDFDALARLLERTGFEVIERESSFPIDLFLLMGDDYVGRDEVGRACHARRMAFEQNLAAAGRGELKRELYRRLAELGLGRTCVVTARRR